MNFSSSHLHCLCLKCHQKKLRNVGLFSSLSKEDKIEEIEGYRMIRREREEEEGGGILIMVRDNIYAGSDLTLTTTDMERDLIISSGIEDPAFSISTLDTSSPA